MDVKVFISPTYISLVGMIGLKIKDRTYDRLKWLKTRFEFVHEATMSWDEFFERISRDVLLILAYDLKERSQGNVSPEDILSILIGKKGKTGGEDEDSEIFTMLSSNATEGGEDVLSSLSRLMSSVGTKKARSKGE